LSDLLGLVLPAQNSFSYPSRCDIES